MYDQKTVLCACASRDFIDRKRVAVLAALLTATGCNVVLVDDLCSKAANGSLGSLAAADDAVVACYPRAVRALFEAAGVAAPGQMFDLRNDAIEDILKGMGIDADGSADEAITEEFAARIAAMLRREGADSWFPVIDKQRCSECEKCHDFCLFGVYAVEDGRVEVHNPANCKNNCPACARICPSGAIIFPKYLHSPINGGLTNEEDIGTIDPRTLYNDALRERLAARRTVGGAVPFLKYEGR